MNVLLDWDMFQMKYEYLGFYVVVRCVSGGLIYIIDVFGEYDMDFIKFMIGVIVCGKIVVFRLSVVGCLVSVYVGFEEGYILKVGSYYGKDDKL